MGTNLSNDNISDQEKLKQIEEGIKCLFEHLDEQNDMYKLAFLEVLFEELYKKDNIYYLNGDGNTNETTGNTGKSPNISG